MNPANVMTDLEEPMIKIFDSLFSKNDILKPVYFDIQILERYFKNPKYLISYTDYRGKIYMKDEYSSEDLEDYEYIKDFGLAYKENEPEKRAVVVFADDLSKLSKKVQAAWYAHLLDNQEDYYPNNGFIQNLIRGEWVTDISIYQALLMEIHYINEMCDCMLIDKLYKKEYKFNTSNQEDRPIHFHNVLMPTRDNYYNFINTLEKLVINNINATTFTKNSVYIGAIEAKDENGNSKGTLRMFEEWLLKNVRGGNPIEDIIKPLKKLRKLRQKPAHQLYVNEYNEKIWSDQNKLVNDVYTAVRNIRLVFSNHPRTSEVEIPSCLFDGEHIVCY